ncbi:hypothetical protein FGG08_003142 [Glutinoglossum americanum]|uniref:Luciferase domain-containing protein n=1 Tax=Glutinoglossum americanum TaxID=1670608 RepID=A0A9P8IAB6_9PEZI|nr:hypothetical protein FGG08_003142 [Glutinoglossum americanum]
MSALEFCIRNSLLLSSSALLAPLLYFIHQDYRSFLELGPGGTPSTFLGYLHVTFLRVFALRNPLIPAPIPDSLSPKTGFFSQGIPERVGARPEVRGIAPHRQVTQKGGLINFASLSKAIQSLATTHPNHLKLDKSCFEKHSIGLFSINPINRTCSGEVYHAHPSDGSLHLTLHLTDARIVIERGWGERHPLARGGWCECYVPLGFVIIYAPREEDERHVVMEIIHAAVWWVSGQALDERRPNLMYS